MSAIPLPPNQPPMPLFHTPLFLYIYLFLLNSQKQKTFCFLQGASVLAARTQLFVSTESTSHTYK